MAFADWFHLPHPDLSFSFENRNTVPTQYEAIRLGPLRVPQLRNETNTIRNINGIVQTGPYFCVSVGLVTMADTK